jgi:hypothetical protein
MAGDLRYCIEQEQDGDSIQFSVKGTINLTGALPPVTRSISIEGPGANLLTVRRDTGGSYGIFTVSGSATASISDLTIRNGRALSGGGILNAGTLTITNSIISENAADVSFKDASGGGIFNSGILTITNSTISGNLAFLGGGGIFNSGTLAITNTTISRNDADSALGTGLAGGIFNSGTLAISNSTISGNFGYEDAGGILNLMLGMLTINNSDISGNRAFAGGGITNDGTLVVSSSTISGNVATGGFDVSRAGGGIANRGLLTVSNSTISDNRAEGKEGQGGGIVNYRTLHMRNTIVAGNTASLGPDLRGSLISSGYNLIGNSQGGSGFDKTDLLDVDPRLGPLQDNGGPTHTHALLSGSPAINAGDPAFEPPPETDQRGFNRIVGKRIDIGAFEVQPPAAYFYIWPDSDAVVAGFPFDVYLLALDADFNLVPDYAGEVAFWSTDEAAVLPAPHTFRPSDGGVAYFFEGVTLNTVGTQYVIAFDTASFTIFGVAGYEVLGAAPGGGEGRGVLDLFAAEVLQGSRKLTGR